MLVWWATEVDAASAVIRQERDGHLSAEGVRTALERLDAFAGSWFVVQPVASVRMVARRLLRVHPLRAADALQMAAAIAAAEGYPETLGFVSLDARLAAAAEREGFTVLAPEGP